MMSSPAEGVRLVAAGAVLVTLLGGLLGLGLSAKRTAAEADLAREGNRLLVGELGLTDLALWSGAAYCRHPTQADGFAAWSDHPAAPERFPAGSLVPPQRLRR
jgi:hypothetical protein